MLPAVGHDRLLSPTHLNTPLTMDPRLWSIVACMGIIVLRLWLYSTPQMADLQMWSLVVDMGIIVLWFVLMMLSKHRVAGR